MSELDNQALDAALILEDKLKERVSRIVEKVVINIVGREIHAAIEREKAAMITEITLSIGKALQSIEKDGRKPLWDSKPEDFGLDNMSLNTHNLGESPPLELDNAIQEQSRPQI